MRRVTNAYKILFRKPVKRDYFGYLGVDLRMIWILQKWDVCWLDSSSWRYDSLVGCYENGHSGPLKRSNEPRLSTTFHFLFGFICYRCFALCGAWEAVAVIAVSSCSLYQKVRTITGAHSFFYLRGTGTSSLAVKAAGTWSQLVPIWCRS